MEPALREAVLQLARDAGTAIMRVYVRDFDVGHKADQSPLTEADMASHHLIADELARIAPQWPLLSEESAAIDWSVRAAWQRYWLVDPLDGTREFIRKNGEFTVNVALVDAGAPVFGVIYAPASDELYWGERGRGAFIRDGGEDVPLASRRPAAAPLRVAASRSHRDPASAAAIERMGEVEPISMGSSLKFCRLAEARMDVYTRLAPTSEWDTAAGQCILEASGGCVITRDGAPLRYNTKASLLNPHFLALGDPALPWRNWLE